MKYKDLISHFSFSEKAPVQNEPLPTWSRAFILCVWEKPLHVFGLRTCTHKKQNKQTNKKLLCLKINDIKLAINRKFRIFLKSPFPHASRGDNYQNFLD